MSDTEFAAGKSNKRAKISLIVLIVFGLALVIGAMGLRSATYTWADRQVKTELVKGNRGTTATAGAAAGAGIGAVAGASIGGIGIACCGTGVGIPAGVVCFAISGLCAAIGGGVGYAAGTSDHSVDTVSVVSTTSPLVSSWVLILLLVIGIVLVVYGVVGIFRLVSDEADQMRQN